MFRVAYDKESGTKETLSVQVEDTGRGIPEEKLEEIFLPFQQVGEHSPTAGGNWAWPCHHQKIGQLDGSGTLEVASTVGKGSTFGVKVDTSPSAELEALASAPAGPYDYRVQRRSQTNLGGG